MSLPISQMRSLRLRAVITPAGVAPPMPRRAPRGRAQAELGEQTGDGLCPQEALFPVSGMGSLSKARTPVLQGRCPRWERDAFRAKKP